MQAEIARTFRRGVDVKVNTSQADGKSNNKISFSFFNELCFKNEKTHSFR